MPKTRQLKLGKFGVRKPRAPKPKAPSAPKPKYRTSALPKSQQATKKTIWYAQKIGIKNPQRVKKNDLQYAIHVHRYGWRKQHSSKEANEKLAKIGVKHDGVGKFKK